ncbi:metallophosphoesterase [Tenacibaculum finnmarkense]|uniref:metallophosphoesterase n=1 Tax=Tenacibaculum finnmarkense TaxID=2781243 RepID=UPI00187B31F9|nr:metallophosphoesterase [Tenacibaculum finnmarkense]MBE7659740.1 metallophosphoesterase [Tenacibaculum finnmarkense genomovar finnmarkense]MCG8250776.1 metallophosphoesterase [Tenacibaculum finnmarkense genomovar finnmarkense]MCG8814600.1 metallophosphoesterase [Tenacibaculum finnmarkense]MCG8819619.1 metallophosphoesterase [Tenacibaculum finnmarkense]MCG8900892.1 metallophosphoesterase [Tenacibaculum finnmarkense]
MSRWLLSILSIVFVVVIFEAYAFQAIKTITKNTFIRYAWLSIGFLAYAYFFYVVFSSDRSSGQTLQFQVALGMLLVILLPKLCMLLVLFGEDFFRWIQKGISYISSEETKPLAGRRTFIAKIALAMASIPLAGLLYGIFKGKYNYKVLKYQLSFKDLPEAFDGFTITQITDIHSGSFTNKEKISYAVDLVNQQKSDMILFTGDLVNNFAHEMDNWIDVFKKLEAPVGKYSVLGNHDYGDYSTWKNDADKKANFKAIKELHPKIGFELLLNEHRYIEKDGQKIALVGVENWGKGFNKAGDLGKASEGIKQEDFKILMSHDPSHWENKIKKDVFNYQLTLSGHTHGLQFGIEIPGWIKWSPSQYVYKQWAGLYQEFGRYINVNRGFGYHAFPGRVGIWPEITVIELKKA